MASANSLQRVGSPMDFGRTRWSMVLGVRGGREAAQRSLAELCVRYWVPVYAYVRRCGHAPAASAGLVQGFLTRLVHEIRSGELSAEGGFRGFLQERLERYLASDGSREQTGPPDHAFAPPRALESIEAAQSRAHEPHAAPAQAFQRAFALEVLEQGLAQLRAEAEHAGRGAMFEAVRPFLAREPAPGEYAALAHRLECSPLAAAIAVKRLRQRFQELIDVQVVQTVDSPEALAAERAALLSLLGTGRA